METKTTTPATLGKKKFSFGTGPAADWKLFFVAAALLLIVLAAVDTLEFLRLNAAEAPAISDDGSHSLDLSALRKTTLYYEGKKAQFDKIVGGTATGTLPTDPSI